MLVHGSRSACRRRAGNFRKCRCLIRTCFSHPLSLLLSGAMQPLPRAGAKKRHVRPAWRIIAEGGWAGAATPGPRSTVESCRALPSPPASASPGPARQGVQGRALLARRWQGREGVGSCGAASEESAANEVTCLLGDADLGDGLRQHPMTSELTLVTCERHVARSRLARPPKRCDVGMSISEPLQARRARSRGRQWRLTGELA